MITTSLRRLTENEKGFSLTELVISMFLFSLVGLIAISAVMFISKISFFARNSAKRLEDSQTLALVLQNYLGQAVDVVWTSSTVNNIGSGNGKLRKFTSSLNAGADKTPETVGLYIRENGYPSPSLPTSDLRATALYFRNPTKTTEGVFMISGSGPGHGQAVLSSDHVQQKIGSIVELEVQPGGYNVADGSPVRVVKIRVVYRKFISGSKSEWRWCPQTEIDSGTADCESRATFKDIVQNLKVPLYNNAIETSFTNEDGSPHRETLFGDLYFFNFARGE